MKATGIVRRIDELGRIVIPKEIRKTLRLREGENLEIYTSDDEVILKKYSLVNKLSDFSQQLTDSIYSLLKHNLIITDTDQVIAASGIVKKELMNKTISGNLEEHIVRRDSILESFEKDIEIVDGRWHHGSYTMSTIIVSGDAVGIVFMFSNTEKLTDQDKKIVEISASFLSKYLENN